MSLLRYVIRALQLLSFPFHSAIFSPSLCDVRTPLAGGCVRPAPAQLLASHGLPKFDFPGYRS